MKITYPIGAGDNPFVQLDQNEELRLLSGNRLEFTFSSPFGPRKVALHGNTSSPRAEDESIRNIFLGKYRLENLRKNITQYFPLGMTEGFYLALPVRQRN